MEASGLCHSDYHLTTGATQPDISPGELARMISDFCMRLVLRRNPGRRQSFAQGSGKQMGQQNLAGNRI